VGRLRPAERRDQDARSQNQAIIAVGSLIVTGILLALLAWPGAPGRTEFTTWLEGFGPDPRKQSMAFTLAKHVAIAVSRPIVVLIIGLGYLQLAPDWHNCYIGGRIW
jgi:hypothetical protein